MAQSKQDPGPLPNSLTASMSAAFSNPVLTMFAHLNGTFLEALATAQKDWADFLQRRIREDVAVSRQLMHSQSLADMHQIYSQYLQTVFQQFREQSDRLVQRGEVMAEHLAETAEANTKEMGRARH